MDNLIAITQRVDFIENYNEYRECIDISWFSFLKKIRFDAIQISCQSNPKEILNRIKPKAVILSGGNSLENFEQKDSYKKRDLFELSLIKEAIKSNIKILGICRGAQILNYYFGGQLEKLEGHVSKDHQIEIYFKTINKIITVNSFHNYGITKDTLSKDLIPFGYCKNDNSIEAFIHKSKNIMAIMWHPERGDFQKFNLDLIKEFLDD